ncbi:MAG: hypothetical protein AAF942_11505 [Pseudomonadota bacterium]
MRVGTTFLAIAALGLAAGCTPPPEKVWIKAGATPEAFDGDRKACLATVDRDFNPYYDYGIPGNRSSSQEALFRDDAAEQMYQNCMRGRGYELVLKPRAPAPPPR